MVGASFLNLNTLKIIALGVFAFALSTIGGLLMGKVLYVVTKGKVNPLIGSAGVSAVPMAARVSQDVGRKYNPTNYLLMHAMGPNVAGVIGSAIAAASCCLCSAVKRLPRGRGMTNSGARTARPFGQISGLSTPFDAQTRPLRVAKACKARICAIGSSGLGSRLSALGTQEEQSQGPGTRSESR